MGRRIRVTGIRKEKPDYRLYVLALIALTRQLQEIEDQRAGAATSGPTATGTSEDVSHG